MKHYIIFIGLIAIITTGCGAQQNNTMPEMDHSKMDHSMHDMQNTSSEIEKQDLTSLPQAKSSTVVALKDGDSFNLTAEIVKKTINGTEVQMLAYNGQIPGPRISVEKDAEITINFTNNIDEDTTLHSHGLRLDNAFDGVPNVTQSPVKTGESFAYTLKFPDSGVYWYHPHMREDRQQELGMYGNFYVQAKDPDYWNQVNQEEFIFLDDILLDDEGQIASFSEDNITHTLMGRYGNTFLINGETDFSFEATRGEIVRFFLTNSANTRTFNISLGSDIQLKMVGGDASKYEQEFLTESIILSPSERVVMEAYIPQDFSEENIEIIHSSDDKKTTIGTITIIPGTVDNELSTAFKTLRSNQDTIEDIDQYRSSFGKEVDHRIRLGIDMKMGNMDHSGMNMHHGDSSNPQKIEWEDEMPMMNQMSTDKNLTWQIIDEDTGKTNEDINWEFTQGDIVKMQIHNDASSDHPMQHPFHIHGQRFLVLSTNEVSNTNLVWKDTTLIQTGDTIEILVDMSNPGVWMMHCHIAEHLHSGMMAHFTVQP
jgi:suppressor of ftsI